MRAPLPDDPSPPQRLLTRGGKVFQLDRPNDERVNEWIKESERFASDYEDRMQNLVAEVERRDRKAKEKRFDPLRRDPDRAPPTAHNLRSDGMVLTPSYRPQSGPVHQPTLISPKIEEMDNQSTAVNVGNDGGRRVSFDVFEGRSGGNNGVVPMDVDGPLGGPSGTPIRERRRRSVSPRHSGGSKDNAETHGRTEQRNERTRSKSPPRRDKGKGRVSVAEEEEDNRSVASGKTTYRQRRTALQEVAEEMRVNPAEDAYRMFPARLRMQIEEPLFDMVKFLKQVKVDGLRLGDLLEWSPLVRRLFMKGLKQLPKERRIMLLNEDNGLEEYLSAEKGEWMIAALQQKTQLSAHSAHKLRGQLNRYDVQGVLDGGSCVNLVSKEYARCAGIPVHQRTNRIAFTQVDGSSTDIVGECYEVPIEAGGMIVPISCVVMSRMDVDLILGRPFLEQTNAVADYRRGTFVLTFGGWICIVDAVKNLPVVFRAIEQMNSVYYYLESYPNDLEYWMKAQLNPASRSGTGNAVRNADLAPRRSDRIAAQQGGDTRSQRIPGNLSVTTSSEATGSGEIYLGDMKVLYCDRKEVVEWLKNDEVESQTLLVPDEDAFYEVFGISGEELNELRKKEPLEDVTSGDMTPRYVTDQGYGINLQLETGPIEPTPLISLENEPGLEGYKFGIGDLPENEPYKDRLVAMLKEYLHLFRKDGDQVPPWRNVEPAFYQLKPGIDALPKVKMRRYSQKEAASILAYRKANENYLEESSSRVGCLPLIVKKKDGGDRICINYIPVNKLIQPLVWAIASQEGTARKAAKFVLKSFWDHYQGYYADPTHPDSRWLTAVIWPDGRVTQGKVTFQGFIDSGQWFSKNMDKITDTPLLRKHVAHYVDDGHLCTDTYEEHFEVLLELLRRFTHFNCSLAAKKTGFLVTTFKLLGLIIGYLKLYPDPVLLKKCKGYDIPNSIREMKGFLQFVGFYQNRIPMFPQLAAPLRTLIRSSKQDNVLFRELMQRDENRIHFENMKRAMLESKVLKRFDYDKPVILATDASERALAWVLAQPEGDEKDDEITAETVYSVISFGGRTLTGSELNYSSPEKEVLSACEAMLKNHPYIADKGVHLFVDHRAMLYYWNKGSVNSRITKWFLKMGDYHYHIHHRKREKATDADGLTRLEWGDPGFEKTIDERIDEALDELPEVEIDEGYEVHLVKGDEALYVYTKLMLKGDELPSLSMVMRRKVRRNCQKFMLIEGELYKKDFFRPKLYVAAVDRLAVIQQYHGSEQYPHMGVNATFNIVRLKYFWPFMYEDVRKLVAGCEACQMYERKQKTNRQLHRIPPPSRFNVVLGMDLVGPLPGIKKYAVSIICYLTSWAETTAVRTSNQNDTIRVLREWVWRYGAPAAIICDSGPSFRGTFERFCEGKGIRVNHSSVSYPEANGKVERYQGAIFRWVAISLFERELNVRYWHSLLSQVMWGWNASIKEELGTSPYMLVFGQEPVTERQWSPLEDRVLSVVELEMIMGSEKNDFLVALRELTLLKLGKMREAEARLSASKRLPVGYQPGDEVYLWDKPLTEQHGRKLDPKWLGPYVVKHQVGLGSYVLETHDGRVVSAGRTFNRDHLKPVRPIFDLERLLERYEATLPLMQ